MKSLLDLYSKTLGTGEARPDRTGTGVVGRFATLLEHDLRDGFPATTTKKLNYRAVFAELAGFIEGATSAARFRQLGTKIWDQNANENEAWLRNPVRKGEDDLGRVYGAQWRFWKGEGVEVDQLQELIDSINNDPYGRRHLVTAWNPAENKNMALPPCHILFQCYVSNDGHLDMLMYMRSVDLFLGLPFNIASYAALLHLIAKLTNKKPRRLTQVLGDYHIYANHVEQVKLQIEREPLALPELTIANITSLDQVTPETFQLHGYEHHPPIAAPMAV